MYLYIVRVLAASFFLACLATPILALPEGRRYLENGKTRSPLGLALVFEKNGPTSTNRGSSNFPYESIDKFQREQRQKMEIDPYFDDAEAPGVYDPYYRNADENSHVVEKNSLLADDNEEKWIYSTGDNRAEKLSLDNLNELEDIPALEDDMLAEASFSKDVRRGARQAQNPRPNLIATVAKLSFEKVNETKSAIQQIGTIINNSFGPDTPQTAATIETTTTAGSSNATDSTITTTTPIPRLSRTELQGIVRRNLRGLVRLFNLEWQEAISQSQVSIREFQRDLGNQIRPYFDDNPNVRI